MPYEVFIHSIAGLPRWSIEHHPGPGTNDPEPAQTFFVTAVGYTYQPALEKVLLKLAQVCELPDGCIQLTPHTKKSLGRDREYIETGIHLRFVPNHQTSQRTFLELLPTLIRLLEKTYKVDPRLSQSNPYTGR